MVYEEILKNRQENLKKVNQNDLRENAERVLINNKKRSTMKSIVKKNL